VELRRGSLSPQSQQINNKMSQDPAGVPQPEEVDIKPSKKSGKKPAKKGKKRGLLPQLSAILDAEKTMETSVVEALKSLESGSPLRPRLEQIASEL